MNGRLATSPVTLIIDKAWIRVAVSDEGIGRVSFSSGFSARFATGRLRF